MFFNSNFSIFQSYKDSVKTLYKNILFYISWAVISGIINGFILIGLAVYTEIINFSAMSKNYIAIFSFFKSSIVSLIMKNNSSVITPQESSFFDLLKRIIPENILNTTLSTMSFKEYCTVVLLPLKMSLIFIFILWMVMVMTMSIGYLKTALKFQNGQKARLHEMYKNIYLLPNYVLAKILVFLAVFLLPAISAPMSVFFSKLTEGPVPSTDIFYNTFIFFLLLFITIPFSIFFYQRLRFIKYFIIDQEVNVLQACKLSWKMTQGRVIYLMLFSLISSFNTGARYIPLLGVILVSVSQQAEVSLYRQMSEIEKK